MAGRVNPLWIVLPAQSFYEREPRLYRWGLLPLFYSAPSHSTPPPASVKRARQSTAG